VTRRIAAALLGLIALLLAGVVVPLGLVTARHDRQLFADRATAAANAAASNAEEHLTDSPSQPPTFTLVLRPPSQPTDAVTVYDATGRMIGHSGQSTPTYRQDITAALAHRTTVREPAHPDDTFVVTVPVRSDTRVVGALTLVRDAGTLDRQVFELWLYLGLAGLGAAILAAALAIVLARWVGRPLRHLAATATALGSGSLEARADTGTGPPELRALATTINDMAAQLEDSLDGHRAFVADVSHQLRTPLASMRLRLELLREDVDQATGAELTRTLDEAHRLSRMIDGLLTVARAENTPSTATTIDVGDVLRDRAAAWQPVAAESGVDLRVEFHPAATSELLAAATRDHLDQELDNLIDNALDAVPAGGTILLSATALTDVVRVTVADSGPGMRDEQKARAFRRFWTQTGADRNDRGGRHGSGLGLAIVHRLVTADGGTIQLADADLGGLAAHIDLCRARPLRTAQTQPTTRIPPRDTPTSDPAPGTLRADPTGPR